MAGLSIGIGLQTAYYLSLVTPGPVILNFNLDWSNANSTGLLYTLGY